MVIKIVVQALNTTCLMKESKLELSAIVHLNLEEQ